VFSSGALLQKKEYLISYFPGTVKGLSVGAWVEFQGVQVGQVTNIAVEYYTDEGQFKVPVNYEIWADSAKIIGDHGADLRETYRMLIEEKGLRAKLESVSLVTGQYMIALSLQPDTPMRWVSDNRNVIEIPTLEAERERLAGMMEDIDLEKLISTAIQTLDAVTALVENEAIDSLLSHAGESVREARELITNLNAGFKPLLERIDTTLVHYSTLADTAGKQVSSLVGNLEATSTEIKRLTINLDRQTQGVSKAAVAAFDDAGKTFRSVDDLVGEDSEARYDLELLLKEAASAARSLRILADYIQQNPDALIKGK
jgi:paraquat-inducible protein B